MDVESLKRRFEETYQRRAAVAVRAPGRVNLIGEHTDYNDGFVLPMAIEEQIVACAAPREDRIVTFASQQAAETATVDLDQPIEPGEPAWANYCKGVTAGLLAAGVELCGAEILFGSDIPIGAGLGSSAALEVCTALALLAAVDKLGAVADRELALLCQKAEHEYAGAPVGIMDQAICIMAQAGRALLLDCRDGRVEQIPFDDPSKVVLVVDTKVHHEIAGGQYAARRRQCEQAAEKLGLTALRDADEAMVAKAGRDGKLSRKEHMRARHVVGEIARTLAAAEALKAGDARRFGELMYASHASLRDDYEVSCDELDAVVELAGSCDSVYGARLTGGGFGGSAIILGEANRTEAISRLVADGFEERFGHDCGIFATRAVAGAELLD